jgi:hypothetical protein
MKHWETHPEYIEGCDPCRWATVTPATQVITLERKGEGPHGDLGSREYVNKMFEDRRRNGLPDPVPAEGNDGRWAPAAGVNRSKDYKKVNGGL